MNEIQMISSSTPDKLIIKADEQKVNDSKEKALKEAQRFYSEISEHRVEAEKKRAEMVEEMKIETESRLRNQENQHYEQTGRLLG